jgi:predicted transcriptional regulator
MQISKSEQQVLDVLWQEAPLTVGQVIERLQRQADWHENTIKTLLSRLVDKGAVARSKDGKRFFYAPAISRETVLNEETSGFLQRFFDGRLAPLLAHFGRNHALSAEELREIEAIVEKLKKDAG